jgi:hypothetical protein
MSPLVPTEDRTEDFSSFVLGRAGPVSRVPSLTARVPAVLLPVRFESRLRQESAGLNLLLRIYPDQFHVHSHEAELTAAERAAGIEYWDALWRLGTGADVEDKKAPWRVLATRFGAERAAWIGNQVEPDNLAAMPATPTPADTAPVPAPTYPSTPTRGSSWEQAPLTACLPERWAVYLYRNHIQYQSAAGKPIRRPLPVGPDPDPNAAVPADPKELQIDDDIRWLVDFDEAVEAGMALRIPITRFELTAGIDEVVVVGLNGDGPVAGALRLMELFDAHHYTDGLAFVRQGTPTNNTPGAPSGYSDRDPGFERSFRTERSDTLELADGLAAAQALGIPEATFARVEHADGTDQRNAREMASAVWPATLGYYLSQLMQPVFSPAQVEQARIFFRDRVRARGPLPAFRVGDTPLGVLPTTALGGYDAPPQGSVEARLIYFLLQVLFSFRDAQHPRIGQGDPKDALVKILAAEASARSYRVRHAIGEEWLRSLINLLKIGDEQETMEKQTAPGKATLKRWGFEDWDPRVIHLALSRKSYDVPFDIVQSEPVSETQPLAATFTRSDGTQANYINWIREATIAQLREDDKYYPGEKAPTSLLYKVLRQAALLTYVELAGRLSVAGEIVTSRELREAELVDIREGEPTLTAYRLLETHVPGYGDRREAIGAYLEHVPEPADELAQLGEFRAALDWLATLPSAELERLFTETLDACSHRYDAWATSIATHLLAAQRNPEGGSRYGSHIGGFGILLGVRPETGRPVVTGGEKVAVDALDATRRARVPATPAPPPVFDPGPDSGGFIHAPSLAQARVAAVLRNGHLARRGSGNEFSIDLSSRRVRRALWCLDGVRAGQPLGALLGYRFEAALRRQGLAQFIAAFRNRYPLVAEKLTKTNARPDLVAAPNVLDGLLLYRNAASDIPGWTAPLPVDDDDVSAVRTILADLGDMLDGLGDLSIAESVHQLLQGNYARAGGLLDALSRGDHAPEPEVVRTPRAGVDVTHRLLLLFTDDPPRASGWPAANNPRAKAEKRLDAWLTGVLPDPRNVRCEVRRVDAMGTLPVAVTLDELGVTPLDVLALADAATTPQESELEQRVRYVALGKLPAQTTAVEIVFARQAGWAADELGFPELLAVARSARNMIGGARPLAPQDLAEPQVDAALHGGSLDTAELATRADDALAALDTARADLAAASAAATTATIANLRTRLLEASLCGVPGAIPRTRRNNPAAVAELKAQAAPVIQELERRYEDAKEFDDAFNRADAAPGPLRDHLLALLGRVLRPGFVALPLFTPPTVTPNDDGLTQVLAASSSLVPAGEEHAVARWFQRLTHVREGVARADWLSDLRRLIGRRRPPEPTLGQLPFKNPDRWVALDSSAGAEPESGRVAFAVELPTAYDGSAPHSGLLLDEWPEQIPLATQSTGLAFNYDQPNAMAPQTLLVAVCPDDRDTWDEDLLAAIVYETLDFVKQRSLDYATFSQFKNIPANLPLSLGIPRLGQILPALYFAFNPSRDAVSAEFIDIT